MIDEPFLQARTEALYYYLRFQLPEVRLDLPRYRQHLYRTYTRNRTTAKQAARSWSEYLDHLYGVDWYVCCGCLERQRAAWQVLFATRTGRSDRLLIDALRAHAARFYPGNEHDQESCVSEFWSLLLVPPQDDSLPVLERYDGQRPLAPWLVTVFRNWLISRLNHTRHSFSYDDELTVPPGSEAPAIRDRWSEVFTAAAHDWLAGLDDRQILLLGLLWRYRLDQRSAAKLIGIHEGNISKRLTKINDQLRSQVGAAMRAEGWEGEDSELGEYILREMAAVLLDAPRLSAAYLGQLLAREGKSLPPLPTSAEVY
jgi:RNA polymerase sigma factor (sigma-70 family)